MGNEMSKALIIGAAGFVGGHLAQCLYREFGMEVVVTKLPHETLTGMEYAEVFDLNIMN